MIYKVKIKNISAVKEIHLSFALLHFYDPLLGVLILEETICVMCKEESPVCFVVQVRLVSISRPSFPKIKLKDKQILV